MNTLKLGPGGQVISSAEVAADSCVDEMAEQSSASFVKAPDARDQTRRLAEILPLLRALAKQQAPRLAVKLRGRILFINLSEVISVQAKGDCVWLQQNATCHLLRESISIVAERLEAHGFIRIHRSVLVNTSFVEEIRPLPTGEYSLRVESGREYTVTRTYKKNLKSLAEFWIGTGAFFAS